MTMRVYPRIILAFVLAYPLAQSYVVAGPSLQNGDFSSGLADWTSQVVTIDSGVAVMGEDQSDWAFLEQKFTIPALSLSLSFEYLPLFETDGQESFSASLLDPLSFNPLIATDADPLYPVETYYFMYDWDDVGGVDDILTDPVYVTQTGIGGGWTRVTLDLTSLGGVATDALVAFDFVPGFSDGSLAGEIRLDNVDIEAIPAPSALLLGVIGLGSMSTFRRRIQARITPGL